MYPCILQGLHANLLRLLPVFISTRSHLFTCSLTQTMRYEILLHGHLGTFANHEILKMYCMVIFTLAQSIQDVWSFWLARNLLFKI